MFLLKSIKKFKSHLYLAQNYINLQEYPKKQKIKNG